MSAYRHPFEQLRGIPGIALAFGVVAALWITGSDVLIVSLTHSQRWLAFFLALKGSVCAALAAMAIVTYLRHKTRQQSEMQRELFLAHHDPSTNLFRRAEWIRRVDAMLNSTLAPQEPAAVLTVTVHRYDYLVHRFGFENINQLLSVFGRRLRVLVRAHDLVGSVSPGVFVIYLCGLDSRKQAMEIVDRILETGKRTFLVKDEPVTLNLDIGLCNYPDDGTNAEDLLARADIAMQRAIAEGLNCSCWYSNDMGEQVITRVSLEKDLEKAVDRQEFVLYFQPRVSLEGETLCGCEALLRWKHPRRGLIAPSVFIDVAESTGLIVEIGKWVIAQSASFVRDWIESGLPPISVSVNVSNAQLTKSDFVKDIAEALGENSGYARFMELELTESLAMSDPQLTMQVLAEVKRLGMRVALDDFGTGYSSLSYLQRFPIDCLKIDRSFIIDLIEDKNSQELTKMLITLGHSLGASVLAEGVETHAQVRMLTEYGCDEAQGFLYGQPIPGEQVVAMTEARRAGLRLVRSPKVPGAVLQAAVEATRGAAHARP